MLRTLLFDYGGTLDAPGIPWVERFLEIHAQEGLTEPEERFRAAFGHATRRAYGDKDIAGFGLEQTVAFQVECQLEFLGRRDAVLAARIAERFVRAARADLAASRAALEGLRSRFALGVVSNFYGNVHILLEEAGIGPLLSTIIDSNRVGLSKPDPAIFRMALAKMGCSAAEAMYVGDSFDKDIVGARAAGMRTAWLVGAAAHDCPDPALVDLRLQSLAMLSGLLP